jgi:hypothetical protein
MMRWWQKPIVNATIKLTFWELNWLSYYIMKTMVYDMCYTIVIVGTFIQAYTSISSGFNKMLTTFSPWIKKKYLQCVLSRISMGSCFFSSLFWICNNHFASLIALENMDQKLGSKTNNGGGEQQKTCFLNFLSLLLQINYFSNW